MISKPFRGIQVNRTHPLAKGLVGCWLFNEMTGETVFDLSGNGNNGTLENGVAWGSSEFGSGLKFDGVDDYVVCGSISFAENTAFTIEAWIYYEAYTFYPIILDNGWGQDVFRLSTNERLQIRLNSVSMVEASTVISKNTLHHIAVTRAVDGTIKYYLDGTDDTTGSPSSTVDFNIQIIGNWNANDDRSFNGSIDSVRIYNRALSTEEIAWSYREPYAMFDKHLSPALLYAATAAGVANAAAMMMMLM